MRLLEIGGKDGHLGKLVLTWEGLRRQFGMIESVDEHEIAVEVVGDLLEVKLLGIDMQFLPKLL